MKKNMLSAIAVAVSLALVGCNSTTTPSSPTSQTAGVAIPTVDINYESFKLDNGLTVVVHTDKKAPIVAVNVWYKVGSNT